MRTLVFTLLTALAFPVSHSVWANAPEGMVQVPAGRTQIGSERGLPHERPIFEKDVPGFYMDRTPVTVDAFRAFVKDTGYQTEAERFGDGAVLETGTGRWSLKKGANWQYPLGPEGPEAEGTHPVTQVSWNDADAYCRHYEKRLPTEVEWEHAARNGTGEKVVYAFGDQLIQEGTFMANIWTGIFPVMNTKKDGFLYTSPVGQFGQTPLGLTDMAGNVWEWSADWYRPYDERNTPFEPTPTSEKAQRGGSFLCDPKVCHGFRVSGRSHATPDTSLMHVGFRCVKDKG